MTVSRSPTFGSQALSRRAFTAAGAASVAMSFCGRGARARETAFTIMTVGGTWGDAIRKIIAEPFAKAHNLRLTFDNRPNAQQLAALQASRGQPTIDTIELGGPRMGQAIALGLISKIDQALAPNIKRVFPVLRNDYWAARSIAPWVLSFDKRVFSKEEVEQRGWSILTDPKVKGRVAIPNFGWMGEVWLNSVNQAAGARYDQLDPAFALARKVTKENGGVVMISNDQGMKLFSTGEIVVAPFWSGRTLELQRKNLPLNFALVRGWSPYGFGFSVVAGRANPDLAQKMVDFSLSDEAQLAFARGFAYVPTLQGLEIPSDMPDSRIAPAAFDLAANLDYSEVVKYSDASLERWNKEVVG
ncbi:extracellular solute-binding protein [Limobrevibacterium gyesilva]|uniref:Extracellular solute-binding protein n=1 Tax=Limobrevibacterium gyesilva TaxID=2991712 RepID=A0AA42CHG1_9PROT|nr:extracellular solute-binding protein [Limobrevibacterium gyesilva]MCW3474947.1 extracellular solute-binding protein [Limobrevibacterium gyesilva]